MYSNLLHGKLKTQFLTSVRNSENSLGGTGMWRWRINQKNSNPNGFETSRNFVKMGKSETLETGLL